MPQKKKPDHSTDAVERAYATLRDLIVSGRLAPGTPLIERQTADLAGASRPTVRSALQRLEQEGFVTLARIGGRYSRFLVAPVTVEAMRECYFLMGAVDGLAARAAAQLPSAQRKTLAGALKKLNKKLLAFGRGGEPRFDEIEPTDNEFHGAYVAAAAGPWILREYSTLRPHAKRFGQLYASALTRRIPSEVFQEHEAIVDAIARGRPDAAEAAAVTNWRNAADRFERVMRDEGERGTWQTGAKAAD